MSPSALACWAQRAAGASRPPRELLPGLFLLGLLPRLWLLSAHADGLEPWEYETLATNIASGHGYVIARFGHLVFAFGDGNLYSFLAATLYLLVGHQPMLLAVAQAILASLAAPVIFAIGVRAFGWQVAALGAALAALHPGLLAYKLKLHPLGLDVLLMAVMVLWIGQAGRGPQGGIQAGLALGMGLMSRPTFFLAATVALFVRWRQSPRAALAAVAAIGVALLLAAPWVVRNWVVVGRPIFVSTSLEDVWKGNNPVASGSGLLANGQEVYYAAPAALQSQILQSSELELNDVFTREVVAFVRQDPAAFAALSVHKFVYFWWLSPQAGLRYPPVWLAAYSGYAAMVLSFAAVGAIAIVRGGGLEERKLLGVLAAISLTLSVVHALAYVEGRHRWGIEPLLLLLTARGMFAAAASVHHSGISAHSRLLRRESIR